MRAAMVISPFALTIIAGCASSGLSVPGSIAPPSERLMAAPEQLQPVKAGDDLVKAMAELRAKYGRETLKLTQLQRYVRRLTKPKE